MTVSTAILNADCVKALVNLEGYSFDPAKFALIDQVVSPDGATREAVYQMTEGDEEFPLVVRIGYYRNAKGNGGVGSTNISVKLSTYAQKTNDGVVNYTLPYTLTLATSAPGASALPDYASLVGLLTAIFTVFIPYDAGSPDTTMLDELKFGIVNGFLGHDSTSGV